MAQDGATAPDARATAVAFTATSANATLLDQGTLTSAAHTGQLWVKRKTGTGVIQITQDGGSGWTTIAVTTSWVEFHLTQTLANPTFGIRIVTDTDAVYVWGAQQTISSNKSSIYPLNGTRAADFKLL